MEQKDYRLAAIMYTDIAGFSSMMEKDEAGTLSLLSYHNDLISGIASRHHGTVIKTIGDALLIDFKNTVEALQSAMEIQTELHAYNKAHPQSPLLVRIGLHLGDIYFFENDALGEGINIAARLQSLAKPGCICMSQDVYNLVQNKLEFSATSLGAVPLKNISKEIRAYEVCTPNTEFIPEQPAQRRTPPGETPDREYSETGSIDILDRIRSAILTDIKTSGRRMTIREAREKYGYYGVEAAEVIASLAERGILRKNSEPVESQSDTDGSAASAGDGHYRGSEIGRSIENAVHGIVSEIERSIEASGKRGPLIFSGSERQADHQSRREFRDEMKRRARAAVRGGRGFRDSSFPEEESGQIQTQSHFGLYRDRLVAKAKKVSSGFVGHLTTYLAVNAGLWYINLQTSRSFLWAAIVSASWGIGLVGNLVDSMRLKSQAREAEAMPDDLDPGTLEDYKKLNKERDSMSGHIVSATTVPFLLGLINLLTDPSFLWFLIPSAALAFSLLIHFGSYFRSAPQLKKSIFKSLKIKGGVRGLRRAKEDRNSLDENLGGYADIYRDAERARQALEVQLADMKSPPGDDIRPSLDRYMGQVRLLAQSANEIDRLIEAIPVNELGRDRAALVAKEVQATSASLKSEYRTSIEEIEKQENSFQELKNQSEVIRLRLGSSVNQLKQMRIDMARLKASGAEEGDSGIVQLKARADDLSHYLDDLRAGYEDYSKDPYDELARLEKLAATKTSDQGKLLT